MILDRIKKFIRTLSLKNIVFIYIILYMIAPIISMMTSRFLTTYFYMGVVTAAAIYTFYACSVGNAKKLFGLLLPFIVFEVAEMVLKDQSNYLLAGYQALLYVLPLCIGFYLMTHSSRYMLNTFVIISVTVITTLTTIIGCYANPSASRDLATAEAAQNATTMGYYWQNIGGFHFVYGTVLLYPLMILAYKLKRIPIVVMALLVIIMFYLTTSTEYTLALMLMLLSSLLFFVKRSITVPRFVLLLVIGFVFAVVFSELIVALLTYIGHLIGNDTMTEKMVSPFMGQDSVNGDNRVELYKKSLMAFFHNPMFGTLDHSKTGGHSYVLDTLATYGIPGAAVMIGMYRQVFKVFCVPFRGEDGYSFVVWSFVQVIVLSCLNPSQWLQQMCLFFPCICCFIYNKDLVQEAEDNSVRLVRPLIED